MKLMDMDMVKGHVLVENGVKALIDTGSPLTFGDIDSFEWDGEQVEPAKYNLWGVSIDDIRGMSGVDFDVLVGTDLLKKKPFQIDYRRGEFVFGDLNGKAQWDLGKNLHDSPVVKLKVMGVETLALIDTGAVKSFFVAQPEWGFSEGEHKDFYPGLGQFTAPTWKVPIEVFGEELPLDVVEPPEALIKVLTMFHTGGILGMDILRYGALGFDLNGGKASFERYER